MLDYCGSCVADEVGRGNGERMRLGRASAAIARLNGRAFRRD